MPKVKIEYPETVAVRLNALQKAQFKKNGGAEWLRSMLDGNKPKAKAKAKKSA